MRASYLFAATLFMIGGLSRSLQAQMQDEADLVVSLYKKLPSFSNRASCPGYNLGPWLAAGALMSGKDLGELIEINCAITRDPANTTMDSETLQTLAAGAAISGQSPSALIALHRSVGSLETAQYSVPSGWPDGSALIAAASAITGKPVDQIMELYRTILATSYSRPGTYGSALLAASAAISGKSIQELRELFDRFSGDYLMDSSILLTAAAAVSGRDWKEVENLYQTISSPLPNIGASETAILTFGAAYAFAKHDAAMKARLSDALAKPVQSIKIGDTMTAEESFRFNWHGARWP